MSGPTITATILVDDQASPAMRQMVELAKLIARETSNALKPGSGDAYASQFTKANAAAKHHLDTLANIKKMHGEIAAIAGGVISGKAAHIAKDKIVDYAKYEKDTRYQGIVGNYSPAEQKALDDQRQKFAKQQGIKVEDTLHGQNALVTRDFKADVVVAATDRIMMLAKALNISGEAAAKIAEGKAFGEGHHLATPEEASKVMGNVGDRAVIMNKRGAMTPDDISQNSKFSASTARVANMRPEQADAYAMILKRNQIGGDMSGVSFRGLATHLIAPTAGGLSSLDSMGMKHSNYSRNGSLSVDNTDQVMQRKFGKGLGPEGKAHLQAQIDDDQSGVVESPEKYAAAVVAAMEKDTGKELSKTDQKHVTKAATEQFNLVRSGFDGARMLDDLMKAKPTLNQLIPLVGPKNAGNVALATNNADKYQTYETQLRDSGGIADKIATERNEGLGAALDRLAASADSAEKSLVRVAAAPLEGLTNFAAKAVNFADNLPDGTKLSLLVAGVAGLGAAAIGSVAGVVSLGTSAIGAAAALQSIATKGIPIPGVTPTAPGGKIPSPAVTAPVASAGAGVAGTLGAISKGLGVTALVAAVSPLVYQAVKDETQGVVRDGSRPKSARDAIKADADERMAREIARNEETARQAAADGDARVAAATPRGGNGALRRALREDSVIDESKGLNTSAPVSVSGTVEGSANIAATISIEPSPLFTSKMSNIENQIMSLKGQLGGAQSKLGTSMSGDGNATKSSQPASVTPSTNTGKQ